MDRLKLRITCNLLCNANYTSHLHLYYVHNIKHQPSLAVHAEFQGFRKTIPTEWGLKNNEIYYGLQIWKYFFNFFSVLLLRCEPCLYLGI